MASVLDIVLVLIAYPRTSAGAEQAVVLASHPWSSTAADTPANARATALLRPDSWVHEARWWRQQPDGLLLIGGAPDGGGVNVVVDNPRSEIDGSTPLDGVRALDWSGARLLVYSTQVVPGVDGQPTTKIPLSSFAQRAELRIESFSYGSPDSTLAVGWPDAFDQPTTPRQARGWGSAAESVIRVVDQSATRGTGSQTVLWIVDNGAGGPLTATLHDGQVWRLRANSGVVQIGMRNLAGVWQDSSTMVAVSTTYVMVSVAYDAATNKARVFRDGAFVEELTITGGLWAGSVSQDLVWALAGTWRCGGWAHYSVAKPDAWHQTMATSGVVDDPDLTAGFAFDEGVGSAAFSVSGSVVATVESATWYDTKWGDSHLGGARPQAVLGIAFGVPPILYAADRAGYITGYTADRGAQRHVSEDGHRLKPDHPDTRSLSRTIKATQESITAVPHTDYATLTRWEFATGQGLTRSPASGVGNPTAMTVDRVLLDARTGDARDAGAITTVENQVADETSSFGLTETSSEYADGNLYDGPASPVNLIFPGFVALVDLAGELRVSMARYDGDDSESLISHATNHFGPEAAITITHERSTSKIWRYGWVTPGDSPWRDLIDRIGLSALSTDDGPMFIGFEPDGDLEAFGTRFSGSDDFTIQPAKIRDIVRERLAHAKPGVVVIRYARCWGTVPPAESLVVNDPLPAAMRTEWLTHQEGSGARRGYFDSATMFGDDAARQAVAIKRLQGGDVYRVELYAPVDDQTIRAVKGGRLTTVTWPEREEWAGGVQGVVVAWRAGISTLTFWLWAEVS